METVIEIKGEVIEGAYQRFKSQYKLGTTSLVLEIDSLGGLVTEGFLIADFIRGLDIPTKSVIVGKCASIATYIARTCKECIWQENNESGRFYLVHTPRVMEDIECSEFVCDADFFNSTGQDLGEAEGQIRSLYLHKTKASLAEINELMATEMRMTPQDALRLGFIDKIEKQNPKNFMSNFFDKLASGIAKVFASKELRESILAESQAVYIELDNGATLFVESEDGELEGKRVFDEAGNPAPNGVHKLIDNREITVQDGVITSVSEMQNALPPENETEAKTEMKMEDIQNLLTQAAENAVAKYIESQKTTAKNFSKPTVVKAFSRKEEVNVPSHIRKLEPVARYLAKKANPHLDFKGEVVAPDYNITWEGTWLTEILREKVVSAPDFMQLFTVLDNVRYRQILQIAGFLEDIVLPYEGCGEPTPSEGTTITDRFVETVKLQVYLEQCAQDFDNTILMMKQRSGSVNRADLSGTELWDLYLDLIVDALRRGLFNLLSFGKSTGTGVNPAYSAIDGIWTRLLADSTTATEACVRKFTDITVLNQTAGSRAQDYLQTMYESSPIVLRTMPNAEKKFLVTPNIYYNYLTSVENRTATEGAFRLLQDGTQQLMYRGIDVVPIFAWEHSLLSPKNPYYNVYNTLILYTTPKNHYVGIDGVQEETRAWFDPNTDLNKFKALPVLGYNYALCDLQSIMVGKV